MTIQNDKLVFLFTSEAANAVEKNSVVTRRDLETVDTVRVAFLHGETQTPEIIEGYVKTFGDNLKIILEDPTKGEIAEAAKTHKVETFSATHVHKMYGSWTCSAV